MGDEVAFTDESVIPVENLNLVETNKLTGPGTSKDVLLEVHVKIENTRKTKLVNYQSWGSTEFGRQPGLEDNFNN